PQRKPAATRPKWYGTSSGPSSFRPIRRSARRSTPSGRTAGGRPRLQPDGSPPPVRLPGRINFKAMDFPALATGLASVREVVADRQPRAGVAHAVRIVAVTKTHGPAAVRASWNAGLRDVGENRVQEALPKQDATS